jgi:hypothetical protein
MAAMTAGTTSLSLSGDVPKPIWGIAFPFLRGIIGVLIIPIVT